MGVLLFACCAVLMYVAIGGLLRVCCVLWTVDVILEVMCECVSDVLRHMSRVPVRPAAVLSLNRIVRLGSMMIDM